MERFTLLGDGGSFNHRTIKSVYTTQAKNGGKQMGSEEKNAAVHEEIKKVNQLPAHSTYATHRIRVLNKILQLLSVQRTTSQDKELELLFAGFQSELFCVDLKQVAGISTPSSWMIYGLVYKVHSYNTNGLCVVGFMDDHYPVRSAFSILNKVMDEYQKCFGDSWKTIQADGTQPWPYLNEAVTKFQLRRCMDTPMQRVHPPLLVLIFLELRFDLVTSKVDESGFPDIVGSAYCVAPEVLRRRSWVDPKSILCEFFKAGQCAKGFKCVCMGLFDTKVEAACRASEDRTIPLNVIAEKTKLTVEHVVKQDEKEDQKRGTAKENNTLPIKTTKKPFKPN
ncbi:hypothetical protein L2E82_27519 [Cichorium intybus]|uniref:Uncharacterized protein n=1 Tax=Cichorium intybus TaxID=13427 RepID=A0ACB9CTD0_CICIN|nr:hypothetical protein L2E82_27519 [Cichorium intybus]